MLSISEARAKVLGAVAPLGTEEVFVRDAGGRVSAADLTAPHPLPRFDNSAMDGYAVRSADCAGASESSPVSLVLAGEIQAGSDADVKVTEGTAVRIMTGAPMPPGADAVVPVEMTGEEGGEVTLTLAPEPGRHVRPAGDDLAQGERVVSRGDVLGPGELALLASLGVSPLEVFRRPRVALLVTGDEIVPPESDPAPGQIRDSNSVALAALIAAAGAEPLLRGAVPDDREATLAAFADAARDADLVVSSGGVAVGRYDFVKDVIEELGSIDMWRVAMQPGKPVVLGSIGEVPFLGLPGNPVSIHVGFEQFVRPALLKMQGATRLLRPVIRAALTEPLDKPAGRTHLVRVRLAQSESGWEATPTGAQGSHIQSSLIDCHGVAVFPAEETHLDAGTMTEVEVWDLPGRPAGGEDA